METKKSRISHLAGTAEKGLGSVSFVEHSEAVGFKPDFFEVNVFLEAQHQIHPQAFDLIILEDTVFFVRELKNFILSRV